ncbi:MAG: YIP1 family protein [Anaerolineales bacterium]
MQRIMGAFTFKREVYAEVKADTSFTPTAWGIVVGVQLLNQVAGYLAATAIATATISAFGGLGELGAVGAVAGGSLVGALVSTVIGVAAFAVGVYVVMFVAKAMFQSTVSFDQLVRTMGLASVWGLIGFLIILAAISPLFLCLVGIVGLAGAILSAISSAIAVKEAVGLDWTQTIITIVIAWVAIFIVTAILGSLVAGFAFMGAL